MKVGDLVCWQHDVMKGHPDDAFLIVIDMRPPLTLGDHRGEWVCVVSPPSGWMRTIPVAELEVVSSYDY